MIKINNKEIKFGKFPNGELILYKKQFLNIIPEKINDINGFHIKWKYENDTDFIKLLFVKTELEALQSKLGISTSSSIILTILYFPYSRMDRENENYTFSLQYISNFINSLEFGTVIINEPHSDLCIKLTDYSISRFYTPDLLNKYESEIDFNKDKDFLIFPDKGAYDRYESLFLEYVSIYADKKRNFETGIIEDLTINDLGIDISGTNIIIIDDLCSKGGTFLWAAEKLKEKGVNKIYLIVGHCETTIKRGELLNSEIIEHVYTTNSIISKDEELFENNLTIMNVI
jgi:ribose-phosphate pyrophosphokinase